MRHLAAAVLTRARLDAQGQAVGRATETERATFRADAREWLADADGAGLAFWCGMCDLDGDLACLACGWRGYRRALSVSQSQDNSLADLADRLRKTLRSTSEGER